MYLVGNVYNVNRPAKRQRVSRNSYVPAVAAVALLERLSNIRSFSVEVRDAHRSLVYEYDERVAAKRAAAKAASKIAPVSTNSRVAAFSRGAVVEDASVASAQRTVSAAFSSPPSAMALLFEQEPPEKAMVEQSVIWRAHLINRRNAELARERLPKQPEAPRCKTHWDYLLDEAVWLANDFREERKWKIQLARKISKMVLQYHSQRAQRRQRAERDEHLRIIRVANAIARDVKKFWNQIHEIADYKESVRQNVRLAEERRHQLDFVLKQAEAYTNVLVSNFGVNSVSPIPESPSDAILSDSGRHPGHFRDGRSSQGNPEAETVASLPRKRPRVELESLGLLSIDDPADTNDPKSLDAPSSKSGLERMDPSTDESVASEGTDDLEGDFEMAHHSDNEASLSADEAAEEKDPEEIQRLQGEACLSRDDLLRLQGIDPMKYAQDSRLYAAQGSESERSDDSSDEASIGSNNRQPDSVSDDDDEDGSCQAKKANDHLMMSLSENQSREKYDTKKNALRNPAIENVVPGTHEILDSGGKFNGDVVAAVLMSDHPDNAKMEDDKNLDLSQRSEDAMKFNPEAVASMERVRCTAASKLLQGSLRNYQLTGLNWLVTMYENRFNGILADEMGLGKTIQTIALLAWLAVDRGIWGPHLVVVPTSVMLNWEVEFKKWLPGFKVLTYYGTLKERRLKRRGWAKPNLFHVCITSYSLVVQDAAALKRKRWCYLILDEAHNIKNFQSQRWQTLLNFRSKRRLLLTGTPLQNSIMELWSLLHFLMPEVFRSHAEFKDLFFKPLASMVNESDTDVTNHGSSGVVDNLHRVLRPFLLRRLKADVEKNLPGKYEHIVYCLLSKRQRQLYEDFLSRSDIKETLDCGDFIGVMNVLMQLRKVCNHPDLFEGRPIVSPFFVSRIFYPTAKLVAEALDVKPLQNINMELLGLDLANQEVAGWRGKWFSSECARLCATSEILRTLADVKDRDFIRVDWRTHNDSENGTLRLYASKAASARRATLRRNAVLNDLRTRRRGMLGADLIAAATMSTSTLIQSVKEWRRGSWAICPSSLLSTVWDLAEVSRRAHVLSEKFVVSVHSTIAPVVELRYAGDDSWHRQAAERAMALSTHSSPWRSLFRSYDIRSRVGLPDARLIQWDCGKLQALDKLLRKLKSENHRVLIFTQMTRLLDILESFLNLHAHRYLRLDGATRTEERQKLVERFNTDTRIFCMILTTRAGGLGLNLVGADTVVFYDTDYNPSMDAQAQDRAHRIGQTRPVHIYRLVTERTIEENILRKAQQKRTLESLVISSAGFTTDAFRKKLDVMALVRPEATVLPVRDDSSQTAEDRDIKLSANSDVGRNMHMKETHELENGPRNVAATCPPERSTDAAVIKSLHFNKEFHSDTPTCSQSDSKIKDDRGNVDEYHNRHQGLNFPEESDLMVSAPSATNYGSGNTGILPLDDYDDYNACKQQRIEEELAEAEFHDTAPSVEIVSKVTPDLEEDSNFDIASKLTPVQMYALKLVEFMSKDSRESQYFRNVSGVPAGNECCTELPKWHMEFSVEEMIRRHEKDEMSLSGSVSGSEGGESDEDHDDLVYEVDASNEGNEAYLKALTDTDADIKLYLPLRDGDPEELKKSNVLGGAAAAGLECAEDAAFFYHVYNRMSRTSYATRRQKEKAAATLARKLAEEKKLQVKENNEVLDCHRKAISNTQTSNEHANEKGKPPVKPKAALQNSAKVNSGTLQPKRVRSDVNTKTKTGMAHGSAIIAGQPAQGSPELSSGLFPKPVKKIKNKVVHVFQGKSGLNANVPVSKEEIGVNDGWTILEEQRLLNLVDTHSKNMVLVADALSMDPRVASGHRITRGEKRCIDRMRMLTKDMKVGVPMCQATVKDVDVMRRHCKALADASHLLQVHPPAWMRSNNSRVSEPHASHSRAARDAVKLNRHKISSGPPTAAAVNALVHAPDNHRPGYKPSECTPAALARKRRPFMRPRTVSDRRSADFSSHVTSKHVLAPLTGSNSNALYKGGGLIMGGPQVNAVQQKGKAPRQNASTLRSTNSDIVHHVSISQHARPGMSQTSGSHKPNFLHPVDRVRDYAVQTLNATGAPKNNSNRRASAVKSSTGKHSELAAPPTILAVPATTFPTPINLPNTSLHNEATGSLSSNLLVRDNAVSSNTATLVPATVPLGDMTKHSPLQRQGSFLESRIPVHSTPDTRPNFVNAFENVKQVPSSENSLPSELANTCRNEDRNG